MLGQEVLLRSGRYGVAISWDKGNGPPVDVDLQALIVDHKGCIIDAVYYNNMKALRCITHSGDELTGDKAGFDEVIWCGLAKLPETVRMIIFVVAAHSGGHLHDVQNGVIHLLGEDKQEMAETAMERSEEEVDLVAMMLRSADGSWKFSFQDEPAQDGQHFMDILEPTIGNLVRRHINGAPRRQKVAFAMEKGAVLDLPQSTSLQSVSAGLGWDVTGQGIDLDVSAVLFTAQGLHDAVFFGNLKAAGLEHSGDNLTGAGAGDDETIICNLEAVPSNITQIIFVVNIYTKGRTFQQVANPYCRILDNQQQELARYSLTEAGNQTGLVMARLFREDASRWGFQAVGQFCSGRTYKDSASFLQSLAGVAPRELQMGLAPPATYRPGVAPMAAPPGEQNACCSLQ